MLELLDWNTHGMVDMMWSAAATQLERFDFSFWAGPSW